MSADILTTSQWHESLAGLIADAGNDTFLESFTATCGLITPYTSLLFIAVNERQRPQYLYYNLETEHTAAQLKPYFTGAYLVDPLYGLHQKHRASGIFRFTEIAPDEFYENEYYRTYYADIMLKDESGVLVRVNDTLSILIYMGITGPEDCISETQWRNLRMVAPVLTGLCQKHWSLCPVEPVPQDDTLSVPLDLAFRNFGRDHLSERECEVLQLILKGHSSKSIARLLDISPDTVKVHRKRFHAKLDISSQAELFSLFLEAIAMVPMGSSTDPLNLYFEQTRSPQ